MWLENIDTITMQIHTTYVNICHKQEPQSHLYPSCWIRKKPTTQKGNKAWRSDRLASSLQQCLLVLPPLAPISGSIIYSVLISQKQHLSCEAGFAFAEKEGRNCRANPDAYRGSARPPQAPGKSGASRALTVNSFIGQKSHWHIFPTAPILSTPISESGPAFIIHPPLGSKWIWSNSQIQWRQQSIVEVKTGKLGTQKLR